MNTQELNKLRELISLGNAENKRLSAAIDNVRVSTKLPLITNPDPSLFVDRHFIKAYLEENNFFDNIKSVNEQHVSNLILFLRLRVVARERTYASSHRGKDLYSMISFKKGLEGLRKVREASG